MNRKLRMAATLLLVSVSADAQTVSRNGLETDDYKRVGVLIEDDKEALTIGLTEDRIRTRVELRLRSVGLRPEKSDPTTLRPFLYVNIDVMGSGTHVFSISLEYTRIVTFSVHGQQFQYVGKVWSESGSGVYRADAEVIWKGLDQTVDLFLDEYLKANQK